MCMRNEGHLLYALISETGSTYCSIGWSCLRQSKQVKRLPRHRERGLGIRV